MPVLKLITILSIVLLFVGTSIAAIMGASGVFGAVLRTYVLKVQTCEYAPLSAPAKSGVQSLESEKNCYIDYNQTNRDLANGIGLLLAAAPIAILLSRKTFSALKDLRND